MLSDPLEACAFARIDEASRRVLPASFFEGEPHAITQGLLGRDLVRVQVDGTRLSGRIVEVELYGYIRDAASHGDRGVPSKRTFPLYGRPGGAYVYQIYGMYYCLNVVGPTGERPTALLIRALHPLEGIDDMARARGLADRYDQVMPKAVRRNLLSGPGKLCQAMAIDRQFNGHRLDGGALFLTEGVEIEKLDGVNIAQGPRIGLNPKTVGDAAQWPWRYVVQGSPYLSKPL